ncbi:MAG TPA: lactate racemase domain-containing protein [Thermoanaerobaculaceae bacterium]|nr:lactate racemase domain-containing protein [Thermoanaerobaculaceae bacterium]
MILKLPYGRGTIVADLRGLHCQELKPSAPHHATPLAALAVAALDRPTEGPSLAELARGRRRATVLVPDATRKTALHEVLPPVLERLAGSGVAAASTTVLVACGTHPPVDPDALAELVGPLPPGVTVVQHDARDEAELVEVGALPSGVPVRLNRAAVEADLLVEISSVQHHYFAGFGGGPKLVFPGVAGYAETQANHARVIDLTVDPPRRHPGCEPGAVDGNPVAEEINAAASLRPPDFALLLVPGEDGRPAWAIGGPLDVVYPQACQKAREWFEVEAGPFRKVVVAAGGFPTDHTLIQAHKALDAGCRFAAPGAEVVFVAACDGGAGSPEMEPFLADPWPEAIAARLAEKYVQYGHTTLRLVEKTSRYEVLAKTELAAPLAERLGLRPIHDVQGVLDRWRDEAPHEAIGLIAGAPVYPRRH